MTDQHPITPPPELVRLWATTGGTHYEDLATLLQSVATKAARWGADQKLEGATNDELIDPKRERAAANVEAQLFPWRYRDAALAEPEPQSLKEQALAALSRLNIGSLCANPVADKEIIRRALEQLDD